MDNVSYQLRNGQLVSIPPVLIRRLKSHFLSLPCGVDLILGLNGYIWISKLTKANEQEGEEGFDAEAVYSSRNDVSQVRVCLWAIWAEIYIPGYKRSHASRCVSCDQHHPCSCCTLCATHRYSLVGCIRVGYRARRRHKGHIEPRGRRGISYRYQRAEIINCITYVQGCVTIQGTQYY